MFLLLSGAILLIILYYYAYPLWASMGLRSGFTDSLMLTIYQGGSFSNPYAVRFVCLFFCGVAVIVRSGSSKDSPWRKILIPLLSGVALFFAAPMLGNRWVFILTTFFGYCLFSWEPFFWAGNTVALMLTCPIIGTVSNSANSLYLTRIA